MKTALKVLIILLLISAIVCGILWAILPAQRCRLNLWIADLTVQMGFEEIACKQYEDALRIDPRNDEARKLVIDYYRTKQNYTKVEYHLIGGIEANPGNAAYYEELSRVYVEQGKFYDAVDMLDQITNPLVQKRIAAQRPQAPEILPESGHYRGSLSITVTAPAGTTIYCSDQGEFPTEYDRYQADEIPPQPGQFTVLALCIGENGLVSPLTTKSFTYEPEVAAVEFVDPEAENIIRRILQRPVGDISSADLRSIRSFTNLQDGTTIPLTTTADLKWLTDLDTLELSQVPAALESIQYLASLRYLSLRNCGITDLSPLRSLKELEFLDLSQNNISHLEPLSDLTRLERLIVRQNSIVKLTGISSLSKLIQLDAGENAISDLTPLESCTLLGSLALDSNKISDLLPLSVLSELTTLELSQNEIIDISPLRACTSLQALSFSGNKVELIDALRSCVDLNSLTARKNNISDLTPLGSLINLNILDLSGNVIENADALAGAVSLKNVDLSKNFIADISALAVLQNLVELNLENNLVSNLNPLVSCSSLQTVYAFGTKVKTVDALKNAGITVYK